MLQVQEQQYEERITLLRAEIDKGLREKLCPSLVNWERRLQLVAGSVISKLIRMANYYLSTAALADLDDIWILLRIASQKRTRG